MSFDTDMRRLADEQLRRENRELRAENAELVAAVRKARQIVGGHRTSPWRYLPHYTMDTVHKVRDEL